jgi:long-chain acyl-CoA synthetase
VRGRGEREFAGEGDLAASQIHRFLILHKELDPDDDEPTRTRRGATFVAEKYRVLIDALYGGKTVETLVR